MLLAPRRLVAVLAAAAAASSSAAAQESPPAPVYPIERLVPVAPGESLWVTIAGRGPPIVLIPGLFGSAFGFRHLVDRLPKSGYRVIVIEPLGIGRSPRPRRADYSLTSQADRLAAALDAIAEGPAILVAHSVAVSIALRVALRHPDRVRAVIALDGGPAEAAATRGFRRAMQFAPWVKWLGGSKRVRSQVRKELVAASGDPSWITDSVLDGYLAGATADLDGTLLAFLAMADAREPERLTPRLGDIKCPVRLVIGTAPHKGGIIRGDFELLVERLPSFAVDSVPGVGQYLFEERPEAVVDIIRAMVERLGVVAETRRP